MQLDKEIERITSNDLKDRHSFFQLHFFLIGKEPTNQAKLWRCVRELKTRKESIEALKLEIDDVNDDVSLINIELQENAPTKGDVKAEILFRKLERKKTAALTRLSTLSARMDSLEEECAFIVKAFNSLEQLEKLQPHDDINAQKEYWNEKLGQEFNLRLLFGLPPDLELIKTILALNADAPVKVDTLNFIESMQKRIENENKNKELEQIIKQTKESHKLGTEKVFRESE
jgi:hypothetical protein